jgi:hypothetical protein
MDSTKAHSLELQAPGHPVAGPPRTMLTRSEELGALACQFSAKQELLCRTQQPSELAAWLAAPAVMARVKAAVADQGGFCTVFPGCHVAVIEHRDGAATCGWTAAVLLGAEALVEPVFVEACAQAGLHPRAVAAQAAPLARFSGATARMVATALRSAAADQDLIREQQAALNGFTAQLSDSFDTMDLLYSVGRSMRAPFQPEQFLGFVADRLHATMNFRWIAVRFGDLAGAAAGLRDRIFGAGHLPVGLELFRASTASLLTGQPLDGPRVLDGVANLCGEGSKQVLVQPVVCKGERIGLVLAGGKHGADPHISSYDMQLVEAAAGYINAFCENVALYEDQHDLFMGTVQALTAAIDAKDRYTCGRWRWPWA